VAQKSHGFGLTWKLTIGLVALITLLGVLTVTVVYGLTRVALRRQLEQRTLAIAANLSNAAAGNVVRRNSLELFALVRKYALLPGVEYVYIEDAKGVVMAHTLGVFPPELKSSSDDRQQTEVRTLKFREKTVYETRAPILEGQVGAVYIGVRGDFIQEEVRRALFPIVGTIIVIFIAGIILSILLARIITRPIRRLSYMADRISKGDLDTPVNIEAPDEIGALAQSLEKMRSSLKVALALHSRQQP
jgi:HAMP domain-containing protein